MIGSQSLRILIVDDHPMVRSGLRDFILAYDWMEAVGEAKNGLEAVEFCVNHEVDVILMDVSLANSIYQGKSIDGITITQLL